MVKDFHNDLDWSKIPKVKEFAINCIRDFLFQQRNVSRVAVHNSIIDGGNGIGLEYINPNKHQSNPELTACICQSKNERFGDVVIHFWLNGERPHYRFIEVKTRKPHILKHFRTDSCIVFEDLSNVERNGVSSAITESKSWYWLYILTEETKNNTIDFASGWMFRTIQTAEFVRDNGHKYRAIYSDNGFYHTRSRLIPIWDVNKFLVWTSIQPLASPADLFFG
jgi:hypothetical protein